MFLICCFNFDTNILSVFPPACETATLAHSNSVVSVTFMLTYLTHWPLGDLYLILGRQVSS